VEGGSVSGAGGLCLSRRRRHTRLVSDWSSDVCSSDLNGSMDGQLYQAQLNAVDVCWWTDHDHRMDGIGYRDVTHFTSFSETGGPGQGGAWDWVKQESGPNTSASAGGIVTNPSSPNDPVAGGSLHLAAQSSSTNPAKFGYFADCHRA